MKRFPLLLLGLAAAQGAWSAQPVGRLFFTPAERAALDAARVQKPGPPQTAAAPQEPPRPTTQTITYSGIVRRNDGKSTLWLNNKPVDEKDALSGLAVTGRVRADGGVTLQVPETGARIDLKVGQRAELQTGRVAESRRDDAAAAKKDEAAKGEPAKPAGEARPEASRPKAGEPEAPEKKVEAAPPPAQAASRDGISHGDLQQRAKPK